MQKTLFCNLFSNKAVYIWILIVGATIIICRRPDIVLYPQFWAEDGKVWYADAYRYGLIAVMFPHSGYFQTISRLIAVASQAVPLYTAPLFFNIFAIFFRIAPALFLWSTRFDRLIPSRRTRLFLIGAYLLLPNSAEIFANVTNIQSYLALLSALILISETPNTKNGRVFNIVALTLSGLSGPFVFMLLPIAVIRYIKQHEPKYRHVLWPLIGTFIVQATSLILTVSQSRFHTPLGANLPLFIQIVTGQIFIAGLVGQTGYASIVRHGLMIPIIFYPIFTIGCILIAYSFWKAELGFKMFWLFSGFVLAASLILPAASNTIPQWQIMVTPGLAGRYWFIPIIAWISLIFWMVQGRNKKLIRTIGLFGLTFLAIGIILDFHIPAWTNHNFPNQVRMFSTVPVGTNFIFQLEPTGWIMNLHKK